MKNILSSSTTINDNVLINLIINIYITFINIRFTMSANVTIYMCMIRFKKKWGGNFKAHKHDYLCSPNICFPSLHQNFKNNWELILKHIEKIICIFRAHKHDYFCCSDICCPSPHCAEQIMVSPLHYRPSTYWTTRMTTTMIMTTETMMMMMFLLYFIRVSLNIEITLSHNS